MIPIPSPTNKITFLALRACGRSRFAASTASFPELNQNSGDSAIAGCPNPSINHPVINAATKALILVIRFMFTYPC
ncbi:MAG: hypothetical protein ACREUQ_01220, partial [Burkholderiales bacterium]